MGELSQRILCDNAKMTRIVDYLEKNGWAKRRNDVADRRAQRVYLTAVGANHRAEADVAHQAFLQQLFANLTLSQKEQLQQYLTTLRGNL